MAEVLTGIDFKNEVEANQKRHQSLEKRRAQANARLEEAKRQHTALAAEVKEAFGTDDVEKLAALLSQKEKENNDKLTHYVSQLDELERQVQLLEAALNTGASPSAGSASAAGKASHVAL